MLTMKPELRASLAATARTFDRHGEFMPIDTDLVIALLDYVIALEGVSYYADSVCGMLEASGWPGKAEALESRIKKTIECATALNALDSNT